ncbi:MAG: LacI family transcriptional regulator [Clostridiales bacterium]|nr:LacI family transcriptional regulator [Clostridiales bacterium]
MVSLKEIAARCNVSTATVSKALNNHSDISEVTKAKVQQVAREMGYFPNAAARSLKTNRTYNIGVLFEDEASSGLTHEYFAHILQHFKTAVEEKGYDLTFINKNIGHYKSMSYYEHCLYRNFDGVIIACIDFKDPEVIELINGKIPVVTVDYIFNNRSAILSNNADGVEQLVNYITDMGHEKIAFIHGKDSAVTRERVGSFYRTTARRGIAIPDEYIRECAYLDSDGAARVTKELLQLNDKPTCILYPDDFAALGGIMALREMGYEVPKDISVAGYDGLSLSRAISPKLTTLVQDTESIGKMAAKYLIDEIESPNIAYAERITIKGNLQKGETVKCLKK